MPRGGLEKSCLKGFWGSELWRAGAFTSGWQCSACKAHLEFHRLLLDPVAWVSTPAQHLGCVVLGKCLLSVPPFSHLQNEDSSNVGLPA